MARRIARIGGRRKRPWGIAAYVKVGASQQQKTFPHGTSEDVINAWALEARGALRATQPVAHTLAHDVERFLATKQGRTRKDFEVWLKRWVAAFGSLSRTSITRSMALEQFEQWRAENYSASSLNHLRTVAISLWKWADGKRHECPAADIAKFQGDNVRKGFFEHEQFEAVRKQLPTDYADLAEFLYFSGWRHSEARGLLWSEIDMAGGIIRLSPERSKNGEGRVLPLEGELKTIIERRPHVGAFVFMRKVQKTGTYLAIGDWLKTWHAATKAAGCPGLIPHDCRRTVVRNLTRAGVPDPVAMRWTGHKTRAVFDRYNIVNEADLRTASSKLSDYINGK
jgi:integrase